jgi:hypothetical protein
LQSEKTIISRFLTVGHLTFDIFAAPADITVVKAKEK